jgi:hypothetical protein
MSYSIQDAQAEFQGQLDEVLQTRDVEGATHLAHLLVDMGDEEEAARFIKIAHQWEREDNYHDEINQN